MKIALILIFIFALNLVSAEDVFKEAKTQLLQEENLEVKIIFANPYNSLTKFEIKEILPQGITLINPNKPDFYEYYDGILKKGYRWQVELKPKETISITYTIHPDNLWEYGINPTVITDSYGISYFSNPIQFNIYCRSNNLCEDDENLLNCPIDCAESFNDNICNYKMDNICDKDCEEDPDCSLKDKGSLTVLFLVLTLVIVLFLINSLINKKRKK